MRWSSISSAASMRRVTISASRWARTTPRRCCRPTCRSSRASLPRVSAWYSRLRIGDLTSFPGACQLQPTCALAEPRSDAGPGLRVPGFAREHTEIDADLLQRPLVFAVGVLAENQLGIG